MTEETNNNKYRKIKDLRDDERPRERLLSNGASSLSDAELLAIVIRDGVKGYSALDISRDLIEKYNGLNQLASCDFSEFKFFKGIGPARSITLSAVFELGRRIQATPLDNLKFVSNPADVANHYISKLKGINNEIFRVLLINSASKIFREVIISQGILNASIVHPREVFKTAITENAASIILLHNHPSGNTTPSKEDLHITRQIKEAGDIINIKVLDHIIIGFNNYYSFAEAGLI
jgi:DNA repair protein RadC